VIFNSGRAGGMLVGVVSSPVSSASDGYVVRIHRPPMALHNIRTRKTGKDPVFLPSWVDSTDGGYVPRATMPKGYTGRWSPENATVRQSDIVSSGFDLGRNGRIDPKVVRETRFISGYLLAVTPHSGGRQGAAPGLHPFFTTNVGGKPSGRARPRAVCSPSRSGLPTPSSSNRFAGLASTSEDSHHLDVLKEQVDAMAREAQEAVDLNDDTSEDGLQVQRRLLASERSERKMRE